MNGIPEKVVNYNVYDDTEKLLGISGEVALPNLESMTETISGAGLLGEYDSVNIGHFGSLSIELTFRTLYEKSFSLMTNTGRPIVLRAAQQSYDVASGQISQRGLKITLRGGPKGLNLGKLGVGTATESVNTMEVMYIKVEESGKVLLELDKQNFIFKINGKNLLADVSKYI